ncbi:MAG: RNA recognition motif domain-containing protein [Candidatus Rariloculaceae bacterium]|nr:RNA-binding protein [Gammaproteobacteria bacterium]|tara:strand:- start:1107 stop:1400 length:294 start_codon:yes stop_codon:yes gene_type:complete
MGKRLYVGNLPYSAGESDLESKFSAYGTVESTNLIIDRNTGRSKGFAFVELASDSEAQAAIEGLNGTDYDGRPMTVNEAKPMRPRGEGGGGGGGGRW